VGGVIFGVLSVWLALRMMAGVDAGTRPPKTHVPFTRRARQMQLFFGRH
jgi:hypothetical protein